ncbi:MAG: OmpA family protein, partial [Prevotellaceae bacterium]|nr:OmpA family protein [Prevotellaceae bacterium]
DAKDKNGDDIDPYRQGYRDAYNDLGDKANNRQPASAQTDNEPVRKNAKPIDYTPAPERNNYYSGDPLLEAEMKRATAEYGKLTDLLVLYVDGYEINQSKLSPIMEKMIDDKIRLLQKYNNDKYIIICEGHTCDLGREEFNLNLGQMRAEVVREYLITKGFMGDNLIATSKGESTPIVVNDSEANRKINRRVVFLIKEKR